MYGFGVVVCGEQRSILVPERASRAQGFGLRFPVAIETCPRKRLCLRHTDDVSTGKMRKFLVVIEKGENSYGAYSPDLPGCVVVGATKEEAEEKMYDAIAFHLEGLREDGLPIPESESVAEYIVVPESR